jgi:hypothetical protein
MAYYSSQGNKTVIRNIEYKNLIQVLPIEDILHGKISN